MESPRSTPCENWSVRRLSLFLIWSLALSVMTFPNPAQAASTCGWDTSTGWVARENKLPGDSTWSNGIAMRYSGDYSQRDQVGGFDKWVQSGINGKRVEGWFDSVSATCGQSVGLHISGNAAPVKISIYRMGYYEGAGARLIDQVAIKSAIPSFAAPEISSAPRSTVTTSWPTSYKFKVDKSTPPGQYLFRMDDGVGKPTFAPLMIENPEARGTTFISAVMTWQAYNQWGGYSLYKGPNLKRTSRSTVASFDRPYDGDGSGQSRYMELPIIRLAEEKGLDLAYATDFDLDENATQIRSATTLVMGGHSEYWTNNMRENLQSAIDKGINLIVFGGNTGYNRIRIEDNRRLAMWRSTKSDPYGEVSDKATTAWRMAPISKPESLLLGSQYIGLGVSGDFTITHPNRWPFNVMAKPDTLKMVVGREVDSPLYAPGPAVETLASSEIKVRGQKATAMATYYNTKSGAGVLDIGTNGWPCAMASICPWHDFVPLNVREDIRAVTLNILSGAAGGPLGKRYPAIVDIPKREKGQKLFINNTRFSR